MFSCEIYEIFKTPFFTEHFRWLLLCFFLTLLLIYLNNPLKKKSVTSHVRKQTKTKLTKSKYFVKQNAFQLIQVHVEENKYEIKP